MPNHILNRLEIIGTPEEINKVKDFVKSEDCTFPMDFNRITPMPPWIYHGGLSSNEEEKYGSENCWYDWSIKNWGTKWNAYQHYYDYLEVKENVIYFATAWDGVPFLMSKLAWIFPTVGFDYCFSDEDYGYNFGHFKFKDTDILYQQVPIEGSPEAYEFAFKMRQDTIDDLVYNYELRYNVLNDSYEQTDMYYEIEKHGRRDDFNPIHFVSNPIRFFR